MDSCSVRAESNHRPDSRYNQTKQLQIRMISIKNRNSKQFRIFFTKFNPDDMIVHP